MPTHKQTYAEGASDERDAFIAYHKRRLRAATNAGAADYVITSLLTWAQARKKRCDARPGGLGRKVVKK